MYVSQKYTYCKVEGNTMVALTHAQRCKYADGPD